MAKERLIYLPLGGAGEVGMNCYVYGYGPADDRRWIVVDLGIGFGDMETAPGVELVLPDQEPRPTELGKYGQLGWTSWVREKDREPSLDVVRTRFTPMTDDVVEAMN